MTTAAPPFDERSLAVIPPWRCVYDLPTEGVRVHKRRANMVERPFIHDPTPEDRLTHAKWARGVAVIYGSVLLLFIGIIIAQCISVESSRNIDVVAASAKPIDPRAR
jgi:hypothetical protein